MAMVLGVADDEDAAFLSRPVDRMRQGARAARPDLLPGEDDPLFELAFIGFNRENEVEHRLKALTKLTTTVYPPLKAREVINAKTGSMLGNGMFQKIADTMDKIAEQKRNGTDGLPSTIIPFKR